MISAQRIEWNNLDSLNFDLITDLAFDSDNGNISSFLNQDGIYTEHYDGHRTVHRAKTNAYFNPTFTLLKNDFGDFNIDEQRRILSWLSTDKPSWLNVYHDDSNALSYRCFGTWESIELYKLGNGRVVGYVVTFASTHPYAWSRQFTYPEVYSTAEEISNNDEINDYLTVLGTTDFTITCKTDEYSKLLYPKVIVKFDKNKDIYIPSSKEPDSSGKNMIPNAIYEYNETYYISIVADKISPVRTEVVILGEDNNLKNLYNIYKDAYFYVKDDHTIRQIVVSDTKYEWNTIVKVGAAIQISTSYVFGGETVTKETIVKGATPGETITLDGTNKVISVVWYDDKGNKIDDVRVMGDDFNWQWFPLVYGDNHITITGNCDVQIQWIEPRKVGSL